MEIEPSKRVPVLLERLLRQSLPTSQIKDYLPYFLKLLTIRLAPFAHSEKTIVKKILKRVTPDSSKRFEELYTKMCTNKLLQSRTSILYILYKINETSGLSIFPLETPKALAKPLNSTVLSAAQEPQIPKTEKEILLDLIFILQGSEGKYLKYSHLEDKYSMQINYFFLPMIKMLDEITEIAIFHKKVTKFISSEKVSLISESLSLSLLNELSEYYRLIGILHKDSKLTIKKVYLWITEPKERMKWLGIISEVCESLKGSQIVSAVFSYSAVGNFTIKNMLFRILEKTSAPLMNMIELWIKEGEINDPFNEFFISENGLVQDSDLWNLKFLLNSDKIPYFFVTKTVENIFLIGKSINFIKICCKHEWTCVIKLEKPKIYDFFAFNSWILSTSGTTNKELLSILFKVYKFPKHCQNIKKFLLLGQGDFHHSLMGQLIPLLNESAKKVKKHSLRSILENSIRNSNFFNEDPEFLNFFDVKLLDSSPLDSGWDVFALEYMINSPLTTIFNDTAMKTYTRIFSFLWVVKRSSFLLNQYQNIRVLVDYQNYDAAKTVIHKIMVFRHILRHFVNNFMSYLILEVVEVSWNKFFSSIFVAKDLDQLILCHNNFLAGLVNKTMVKDKEIYKEIMNLFDICIKSQTVQQSLFDAVRDQISSNEISKKDEEKPGFKDFERSIEKMARSFNENFKNFRKMLS